MTATLLLGATGIPMAPASATAGDAGWAAVRDAAERTQLALLAGGGTIRYRVVVKYEFDTVTDLAPGGRFWRFVDNGEFDRHLSWNVRSASGVTGYEPYSPEPPLASYPRIKGARWTVRTAPDSLNLPLSVLPAEPTGPTTVVTGPTATTVSWSAPYSSTSSTQDFSVTLVPDPGSPGGTGYRLSGFSVGSPNPPVAPIGGASYQVTLGDPGVRLPTTLTRSVPDAYVTSADLAAMDTATAREAVTAAAAAARKARARKASRAALVALVRATLRDPGTGVGTSATVTASAYGARVVNRNAYSGVRTTWTITVGRARSVLTTVRTTREPLAPLS